MPASTTPQEHNSTCYLFADIEDGTQRWERYPERMRAVRRKFEAIFEHHAALAGGIVQHRAGDGLLSAFGPDGAPLACAIALQVELSREDWSAVSGLPVRVAVHAGVVRPVNLAQTLRREFAITPAECRAALALASGERPSAIAARHRIKIGTVRAQLKSVYAKLECHGQAELAAKIMSLDKTNGGAGELDYGAVNRAARMAASAWGGQIVVSAEARANTELPANASYADLGLCWLPGAETPLHLFSLEHPRLKRTGFPPLRLAQSEARNLPAQSGAMFGRDKEVDDLCELVRSHRLITLVGAGGVGKTRIACHVGMLLGETRTVIFVDLEQMAPGDEVLGEIARALRFPWRGDNDSAEELSAYLHHKDFVLILDGAEHAKAQKHVLEKLARDAPRLTLLMTSREPLHLEGERHYRLHGLGGQTASGAVRGDVEPALALFMAAARQANPNFILEEGDEAVFAAICTLLSGSPLGLLLTAQWLRFYPLASILERLREDLSFLQDIDGRAAARHRSLKVVFEGSWALLGEASREALARLSVFRSGFDVTAAEIVAGADAGRLRMLELMGLVSGAGPLRFTLHPVVAQYASEQLATATRRDTALRHGRYYTQWLEARMAELQGKQRASVLDAIAHEFSNIKQGWTTLLREGLCTHNHAECLFFYIAQLGLYGEGALLFSERCRDLDLNTYLDALLANVLFHQGKFEEANELALRVRASAADWRACAHAAHVLGNLAHAGSDWSNAFSYYRYAHALRAEHGDRVGLSYSEGSIALALVASGQADAATPHFKRCFKLSKQVGNSLAVLLARGVAGDVAAQAKDFAGARAHYRLGLEEEIILNNPHLRAGLLLRASNAARAMNDLVAAYDHALAAIALADEYGARALLARAQACARDACLARGQADQAFERAMAVVELRLSMGGAPLELARAVLGVAQVEMQRRRDHAKDLVIALEGVQWGGEDGANYLTLRAQLGLTEPAPVGADVEATARALLARAEDEGLSLR
jgi:predicted ATPase/DNA-binding CsgD family transcriptional regulator